VGGEHESIDDPLEVHAHRLLGEGGLAFGFFGQDGGKVQAGRA
jgi:hypothetical protein